MFRFHPPLVLAVFCLVCLLGLQSCDILAPPALQVVGYGPQSDIVDPAAVSTVWVEFSSEVDHGKAENAFSLKENGTLLSGTFSWNGPRLTLVLARPLGKGKKFELAVGMGVENSAGVSMEREFLKRFTTLGESIRPTVSVAWENGTSFVPAMTITDRLSAMRFEFSESVDRASFYDAFSLSPSLHCAFDWSENDTVCVARPLELLQWQTDYHLILRDSLGDIAGNTVIAGIDRWFHVGTDALPPTVISISNTVGGVRGNRSLTERNAAADVLGFDDGWERNWGLEIDFSEPVLRSSLESLITFEPTIAFSIPATSDYVSQIIISPSSLYKSATIYSMTIRAGLKDMQDNSSTIAYRYRFNCNGPLTQAPQLLALNFRTNPNDAVPTYAQILTDHSTDYEVINLEKFAPAATTRSYVDLYFRIANGAGLDALSILANFSIASTNSCVSLIPVSYQINGINNPVPEFLANTAVMRVFLDVTNQISSGLVLFRLRSGFKDSRGNSGEIDGVWPVMK